MPSSKGPPIPILSVELPGIGSDSPLLVTTTREPFQPVRLYYDIPSRPFVTQRLSGLGCVVTDRTSNRLQWLYDGEASALPLEVASDQVPAAVRPVILGWLRFPKSGGLTIELGSFRRAIAAARFFGPILGPRVVLVRARVINTCFGAGDGHPEALLRRLDQDVTVIDPVVAERQLEKDFEGVRTPEEAERVMQARMQSRLKSKRDVPLVEDFPLAPEEETPNFDHLATTLDLRTVRAVRRWSGEKDLTLTMVILELAQRMHEAGLTDLE
ncbi:MAG: hypothetical protein U0263_35285 [Polyangiaceae bacterium]